MCSSLVATNNNSESRMLGDRFFDVLLCTVILILQMAANEFVLVLLTKENLNHTK